MNDEVKKDDAPKPITRRKNTGEAVSELLDRDEDGNMETLPVTDNNVKLLKLKPFTVIRSRVRDDLGRYVDPGETAWLTHKGATRYLDKNFIRVELPENFNNDTGTAVS